MFFTCEMSISKPSLIPYFFFFFYSKKTYVVGYKSGIRINIFIFLHGNICCGYSLKARAETVGIGL